MGAAPAAGGDLAVPGAGREALSGASSREPGPEEESLKKLTNYVARALVDFPEEVQVMLLQHGASVAFQLQVHPDDLAHVIGRQGRTARSMRLVLSAAAARMGRRATLEIAD